MKARFRLVAWSCLGPLDEGLSRADARLTTPGNRWGIGMNRTANRRLTLVPPQGGAERARPGVVIHATARFEGRWWRDRQRPELRGDRHTVGFVAEHPAAARRRVQGPAGMPLLEPQEEV